MEGFHARTTLAGYRSLIQFHVNGKVLRFVVNVNTVTPPRQNRQLHKAGTFAQTHGAFSYRTAGWASNHLRPFWKVKDSQRRADRERTMPLTPRPTPGSQTSCKNHSFRGRLGERLEESRLKP